MSHEKSYYWVSWTLIAALGALFSPGAPPLRAAESGPLQGTLRSGFPVTRLWAVDRAQVDTLKLSKGQADAFCFPGRWEPTSGEFKVPGLQAGKRYDLLVWTQEARFEGIDMAFPRRVENATPMTPQDREVLETWITKTPQFFDTMRLLRLAADHRHATALVELVRNPGFHDDKGGELIYRVELWYFDNDSGGWAKDPNTEKVMTRWRGRPDSYRAAWQYLPSLGGLLAGEKAHALSLPETLDLRFGLGRGGMAERLGKK